MLTEIPIPASMPEVIRVVAGGCANGGRRFRRWAHAHNERKDPRFGTICFLGHRRIYNGKGEPSATFWHEYAHIVTPGHGHDDVWRAKMRELGQPITERYKKRSRKKATKPRSLSTMRPRYDEPLTERYNEPLQNLLIWKRRSR